MCRRLRLISLMVSLILRTESFSGNMIDLTVLVALIPYESPAGSSSYTQIPRAYSNVASEGSNVAPSSYHHASGKSPAQALIYGDGNGELLEARSPNAHSTPLRYSGYDFHDQGSQPTEGYRQIASRAAKTDRPLSPPRNDRVRIIHENCATLDSRDNMVVYKEKRHRHMDRDQLAHAKLMYGRTCDHCKKTKKRVGVVSCTLKPVNLTTIVLPIPSS